MFTHHGTVSSGSLLVHARVSVHPRLAEISGRARSGRSVVLLLDTGARFSVVAEDVLTSLGVAPTGVTDVRTSLHDVVPRPVYRIVVSLDLVNEYGEQTMAEVLLAVIGSPPAPADLPAAMVVPHQGLLGLDFLKHFRLIYDGPGNRVELIGPLPDRDGG
jgi:hypothetical protein